MKRKHKIVWAGDSTVARNGLDTFPQTGIAQAFEQLIKPDVEILNLAVNGRSTKSFIDQQRMPKAYFNLGEGDFFFIQFGHNDQKIEDPLRYADPFGEFQKNLEKFINVARNRGAEPLLITPICRRQFAPDGTLMRTHGLYPEATLRKAKEMHCKAADLNALSRAELEARGEAGSRALFMNFDAGIYENFPDGLEDNTHLSREGAEVFARLLAEELRSWGGIWEAYLL